MSATIKTNKGRHFFFDNPAAHDYDPEEIAFNRFTGHAGPYSVAQHSVHVMSLLPDKLQLCGLLHDAAEAYLGDVASPLKQLIRPLYKPLEDAVEQAIAAQHGLPFPFPPEIKRADLVMLLSEHRDLMRRNALEGQDTVHWPQDIKPVQWKVVPWPASYAEKQFLYHFERLTRDPR
jgi:hypothetical protein